MAAKAWPGDSQVTSLLYEENIVDSRPITPPCRHVFGTPVSNGLVVLPPDTGNVSFNPKVSMAAETNKRHSSAERIQRKLHSIGRSNSAGGRLIDERSFDHSAAVLEESKTHEPVESELKTQPLIKKANVNPQHIPEKMSNGTLKTVDDINNSFDKLHVDEDLPIELKAEFLGSVMEKNYEKALNLCEKMLTIDPEHRTCLEFQNAIQRKLQQDELSEEGSESGASESTTDDDDDESDNGNTSSGNEGEDESEDDDGDDGDDGDDDDDDDDEEDESETSSDSDIELPPGPMNLLMGGLPLRPSSAQIGDQSRDT